MAPTRNIRYSPWHRLTEYNLTPPKCVSQLNGTQFAQDPSTGRTFYQSKGVLVARTDNGALALTRSFNFTSDTWLTTPALDKTSTRLLGINSAGQAFALKTSDGSYAWTHSFSGLSEEVPTAYDSTADALCVVYNSSLYALSVSSGSVLWSSSVPQDTTKLTSVNGVLAALYNSSAIVAYSASTGSRLWLTSLTNVTSLASGGGNHVLASSTTGRAVWSLNRLTGALRWRWSAPSALSSVIHSSTTKLTYVSLLDDSTAMLYALNGTTGQKKWTATAHSDVSSLDIPISLGSNGTMVLVPSSDSDSLALLDATDGTFLTRFDASSEVAFSAGTQAVVGVADSTLTAYRYCLPGNGIDGRRPAQMVLSPLRPPLHT